MQFTVYRCQLALVQIVGAAFSGLVPDDNVVDLDSGMDKEYIVLDIETTGLSFRTEKITEIGAVRVKDGEIVDTFETFVNPEIPIPERIVELTGITDEMVRGAETIDLVMPKFLALCTQSSKLLVSSSG